MNLLLGGKRDDGITCEAIVGDDGVRDRVLYVICGPGADDFEIIADDIGEDIGAGVMCMDDEFGD